MGQEMNVNSDTHGKDGIGSPHNLNDLKNRAKAKFMGREAVNPMISGKGNSKRAGADYPLDSEKPR
jgi:hypothetical protein